MKLLDYEALRESGRKPRVHGNGFLQLDLNYEGTKRLHIWHNDLPRQEVATPVHDHVFDLRSEVLIGTLIHDELEVWSTIGTGDFVVYRAEQEEGTQNTILVPDNGQVSLKVAQHLVLGEGSIYTFPAWHLHQTDHVGMTATIMEKINAPKQYGRPRVLVPVGQKPDNDFQRDGFDEEELWNYVQTVCMLVNLNIRRTQ